MTDISACDAFEAAVFAALDAGVTGAEVYQDVPEDTAPPVVIIGDIESQPSGGKGSDDETMSLAVDSVVSGEERRPVLLLQQQIKDTLHDATLTRDGWSFRCFQDSASASLLPDATGYYGQNQFTIDASRV